MSLPIPARGSHGVGVVEEGVHEVGARQPDHHAPVEELQHGAIATLCCRRPTRRFAYARLLAPDFAAAALGCTQGVDVDLAEALPGGYSSGELLVRPMSDVYYLAGEKLIGKLP